MKSIITCLVVLFALTACGSKNDGDQATEQTGPKYDSPEYLAKGKVLVGTSDCLTCHHSENKIIGPAHKDVAEKYEFTEANIKKIAKHIIDGGSGIWGDVPMNPHPDMSEADAEQMAAYILSMDGEKFH